METFPIVARLTKIDDNQSEEKVLEFFRRVSAEHCIGFDNADEEVSRDHYHICAKIIGKAPAFRMAFKRFFSVDKANFSIKCEQYDGKGLGYACKNKCVENTSSLAVVPWEKAGVWKTKKKEKGGTYDGFIEYVRGIHPANTSISARMLVYYLLDFKRGRISSFQVEAYINAALYELSPESRARFCTDMVDRVCQKLYPNLVVTNGRTQDVSQETVD